MFKRSGAMRKYILLTTIATVVLAGIAYAADCTSVSDSVTETKCKNLGYTMTATQCSGKNMVKCPLNTNWVWCGTAALSLCEINTNPFINRDYCKGTSEGTGKTYYMPLLTTDEWSSLSINDNDTTLPIPNNSRDTDCILPPGATFLSGAEMCQVASGHSYGAWFGNIATSSGTSLTTTINIDNDIRPSGAPHLRAIGINSLLVNDRFKIKSEIFHYIDIGTLYFGNNLSSEESIQFDPNFTYSELGSRMDVTIDTLYACSTTYKSSTCDGAAGIIKLKNTKLEIGTLGNSGNLCIEMDKDSIVTIGSDTKKYSDVEASSYSSLTQCYNIGTTNGIRVVCTNKGSGCSGYLTKYGLN